MRENEPKTENGAKKQRPERPAADTKRSRRLKRLRDATRSVRFTVWIYFAIFIISILVLIWVFFVSSLEATYRSKKTAGITTVANYILTQWKTSGLTPDVLDVIAHDNDMCVLLQDRYGLSVYSFDVAARSCIIHSVPPAKLREYRRLARESQNGIYYAEMTSSRFGTKTLLFVMAFGDRDDPDGYLLLNTSLEPLDSTVSILRVQMFRVTLSVLVLGFGISVFLSRLISTPLTRITKSAEKMAQGDYNVNFNGRGYTETEKLADTLNYASTEISKVDNMRRDLMANISHDLRTPLTMVKAYAEMIRDLSGDDPVKRDEHLGIIIEESDRLAALVNDIMDLTKLESGAVLNLERFNVGDRLREIMTRYTLLSERDGYSFYLSAPDGIWAEADPIKFDQVIYNLVNNAVNYSGSEKTVYVMLIASGNKAEISVTDTGEGISEELMPLIFDRYYRGEKYKRDIIGTGLGLSIVKQIFILHGFEFGVKSEENTGSTFWFRMERKQSE